MDIHLWKHNLSKPDSIQTHSKYVNNQCSMQTCVKHVSDIHVFIVLHLAQVM